MGRCRVSTARAPLGGQCVKDGPRGQQSSRLVSLPRVRGTRGRSIPAGRQRYGRSEDPVLLCRCGNEALASSQARSARTTMSEEGRESTLLFLRRVTLTHCPRVAHLPGLIRANRERVNDKIMARVNHTSEPVWLRMRTLLFATSRGEPCVCSGTPTPR